MTPQEESLASLAGFFDRAGVPYMIIGGIANSVWGEPRATLDVDATIWIAPAEVAAFVARITTRFHSLVRDPVEFVNQTGVLPLEDSNHVRLDVIFGALPFEEEAIQRAVSVPVAGIQVRFCTAEDLVLHKIVSDRERDLSDAAGIVQRRLPQLDLVYLEPRIAALARDLARPDILERWENWKRAAGRRDPH